MVDKYKGYLKSFLALPINMSDKGIGSVEEACSHYRSRAGEPLELILDYMKK